MNSEDYVTREELQTAERLTRAEANFDLLTAMQKQVNKQVGRAQSTVQVLFVAVGLSFCAYAYQTYVVGQDISSLKTDVSSLQTDVSLLREEFSEEIAGLRSEISSLKTINGAVVHN